MWFTLRLLHYGLWDPFVTLNVWAVDWVFRYLIYSFISGLVVLYSSIINMQHMIIESKLKHTWSSASCKLLINSDNCTLCVWALSRMSITFCKSSFVISQLPLSLLKHNKLKQEIQKCSTLKTNTVSGLFLFLFDPFWQVVYK